MEHEKERKRGGGFFVSFLIANMQYHVNLFTLNVYVSVNTCFNRKQ